MFVGLFGDDDGSRFHAAYFADHDGVWTHGDLEPTASGGGRIDGRSDGILNVRGARIGPARFTGRSRPACPKLRRRWPLRSRRRTRSAAVAVLLLVLKEGQSLGAELAAAHSRELFARCSSLRTCPRSSVSRLDLPTTYSGKRSERAARDAVNGRPIVSAGVLKNPESLEGLADATKLPEDPPMLRRRRRSSRSSGSRGYGPRALLGFATIAKDQSVL